MTAEGPGTVLVSGGSGGLGAAICEELAGRGWDVFAGSRRGVLAEGADRRIVPLEADVTDPDALQDAVAGIISRTGRLDAVICNAGVNESAPAEELGLERARRIIDTNLWGVIYTIRAALPPMRERRRGTLVTVGSLAGMVGPPGEAYYAASKHGIRGFLESLQYEVAQLGIRVHLVEPGFIRTDLAAAQRPPDRPVADYDGLRRALAEHWQRAIAGGMPAGEAARRIVAVLEDPGAPFRTRIGGDAVWVPRFKALLPEKLFFHIASRKFGIGR